MKSGHREVPHTADVALEVWAHDLTELFICAAQGLFDLVAEVDPQASVTSYHQLSLSAPDMETLLVDWLNELLLLHEESGQVCTAFDIALSEPGQLTGIVGTAQAHKLRKAIKAATFHQLAIRQELDGYRTVIVFDV